MLCHVILNGRFLKEGPINIGAPQSFIFDPTRFLLFCNVAIYDCDHSVQKV